MSLQNSPRVDFEPLSRPSPLEIIPVEILNDIFAWTCREDMDTVLLSVSRALRWKLLSHPVVRTLQAFCPEFGTVQICRPWLNPDKEARPSKNCCSILRAYDMEEWLFQADVLDKSWCKPQFVRSIQIALVRRAIKQYWDPLLDRDGYCRSALSYADLWGRLESLTVGYYVGNEEAEIRISDGLSRFSWTKLRVRPMEGRISIRDQLSNSRLEIFIPFFRRVMAAQQAVEAGRVEVFHR